MQKNGVSAGRLFPTIRLLLPTLSKAEKKAAVFLLDHADEIFGLTLHKYAERSGSSQASILRLCKALDM
ncbi:MAG: hypothetical protein LBU23_06415, partial [Planctomycetota bacterium]|nr:hypothetical protein [Planctomycetota bacterium]